MAVSILAISTAALTATTSGAVATSPDASRAAAAPCTVSGAFCATGDGAPPIVLRCGMSASVPWYGAGYWNNRLPDGGRVKMFNEANNLIYTTPANYGPVLGNWDPVWSLRADC
ncbi:hypothetical protein [Streptomyces capparidis]